MSDGIGDDSKLKEMFHKALELLPKLWKQAGFLEEAIGAYCHALPPLDDPEVIYGLGMQNAVQQNIHAAVENAAEYLDKMAGSSTDGWKLSSPVVSAQQNFKESETIVDLAAHKTGEVDGMKFLRLKALLQAAAQQQPKHLIETYRTLRAIIQARREVESWTSNIEVCIICSFVRTSAEDKAI
ncbi:hypothetical protein J5N97_027720 [Dioscorea zingiberensis]|uniref:Uncharacterized protein n=1 Tax=Dioscorea zingiberensis TaxID=325984 RepID=A0A9D5H453_9LILI|nr:hypothetical protein J5N97_027720 [Dioscorea zingiberensis]